MSNQSRASWVIIEQTNEQTLQQRLLLYAYKYRCKINTKTWIGKINKIFIRILLVLIKKTSNIYIYNICIYNSCIYYTYIDRQLYPIYIYNICIYNSCIYFTYIGRQLYPIYIYNICIYNSCIYYIYSGSYINTMKTTFYLSFDCLQAFIEL